MKLNAFITATMILSAIGSMSGQSWSLDSCISYAISHNLTVQNRSIQCASAELDITEARDAFLPQISGYAGQSFSFGRGLTSENTYAHNNTQNFNIGASMSLPLFQGLSAVRRVDYAKANLMTALEQLEAEKDNVELNVTTQYLQVLYARQVAEIAQEQLRLARFELSRRRDLVEAGRLPELDLYEAESQVAQEELNTVTSANDLSLALLDLAQLLDLPEPTEFDILPLSEGEPEMIPDAESIFSIASVNNHSVRAADRQIEAADRQIALARTGYIPRLNFSAGLGTNYYRLGRYENPSFGSQMRHNFSQSLQFSLSVPVFDAFSTRNSIRKAKVQMLSARIQADETRNRLYKSIRQAYHQADGAYRKLTAARIARQSAQNSFDGVREKYNYGKATSADYEQARSNLVRAKLQAIQASFELQLRNRILAFYARENSN